MAGELGEEGGRGDHQDPEGGAGDGGEPRDPEGGDRPTPDDGGEGLSPDILPDFLKGRSEQEVKFYLNQAFSSVETQQDEIRRLRRELEGATATAPEPEPDPDDDKPLEELMLEDTDKALLKWMERKGITRRFDQLESRLGNMAYRVVEEEFPEAKKHRSEIKKILKSSNAPENEDTIMMAFKMLKGEEALAESKKKVREHLSGDRPSQPKGDEGKEEPELSAIEKTFAEAQGMTDEEFLQYKDQELSDSIKLPTG